MSTYPNIIATKDARIAELEAEIEASAELTTENTRLKARLAEALKALDLFEHYGCPICHGDCASANPPVDCCPMEAVRRVREGAPNG